MIKNEKALGYIIIAISVAVPTLVTVLFFINPPELDLNINIYFFPRLHAILNTLTAFCIFTGYLYIRQKRVNIHRALMLTAFVLSALFLCSYVFYHSISEPTVYGGEGIIRYVYYFLLVTHIVLAAAILPLILFTFAKALNGKIEQHRKLAKWTFPLWFYVAVSGVLVYLMISPYYVG
jgi:putative membrane protein